MQSFGEDSERSLAPEPIWPRSAVSRQMMRERTFADGCKNMEYNV